MKKILLGLVMVSVVIASCKKDNSKISAPGGKLQKVSFSVGFSKTVTNFQTNRLLTNSTTPDTALTNYMDVLYYMVFDGTGSNVHNITQLSTDTAFGHYVDNLQAGTYTVVIAGGKLGFSVFSGPLSSAYVYYDAGGNQYPEYIPGFFNKDAFISKTTVIVGATAAGHAFTLNRITSKITVNINDAIPANTTTITVNVVNTNTIYMVGTGTASGVYQAGVSNTIPAAAIGQTNYQLSSLLLCNAAQPFTVEITAMANSGTLASKTINNITFQPNKITLLSGNLFGGSGGGQQVTTDTVWNTPIIKTFP